MLFLDEFFHSGTPQRFDGDPKGSGRYHKGSGENPHQHGTGTYYDRIKELHDLGMPYSKIAKEMGISRSYVSRIEKRALTKILREFIKNNKTI